MKQSTQRLQNKYLSPPTTVAERAQDTATVRNHFNLTTRAMNTRNNNQIQKRTANVGIFQTSPDQPRKTQSFIYLVS